MAGVPSFILALGAGHVKLFLVTNSKFLLSNHVDRIPLIRDAAIRYNRTMGLFTQYIH